MRSIRRSRSGVIDVPFRLVISVMIMAVTLAVTAGFLQSYGRQASDSALRAEAGHLAATIRTVSTLGPLSALSVTLHLEGAGTGHIEYLDLGCRAGEITTCTALRGKVAGLAETWFYLKDGAGRDVHVVGDSPSGVLHLAEGSYTLLVTRTTEPDGTIVVSLRS